MTTAETIEDIMSRPHNRALRLLRDTAQGYRDRSFAVIAASATLVDEIGVDGCPDAVCTRAAKWSRHLVQMAEEIERSIAVLEQHNTAEKP